MIDDEQRAPHWRATTRLAAGIVSVTLVLTVCLALFAPSLNAIVLFGFPLGFYFAGQGLIVLLVVVAFWFASRQERLDRRHGAIEER